MTSNNPSLIAQVYKEFVAAQGAGIGQQDRTKGTQQLWDFANSSQVQPCVPFDLPAFFNKQPLGVM